MNKQIRSITVRNLKKVAYLKMHAYREYTKEIINGRTVYVFAYSDELAKCLDEYAKDRYLRMFLDRYFDVRKEAIDFIKENENEK